MILIPPKSFIALLIVQPQDEVLAVLRMRLDSRTHGRINGVINLNFIMFELLGYVAVAGVADHCIFGAQRLQAILLVDIIWYWLRELRQYV